MTAIAAISDVRLSLFDDSRNLPNAQGRRPVKGVLPFRNIAVKKNYLRIDWR
jgi:hypothetical protein